MKGTFEHRYCTATSRMSNIKLNESFKQGEIKMNMLKKRIKNEKGMTLVELLAVLVILGIIAAIAVPMVTNNIQESRDKANVNEALNIISAAKLKFVEESNFDGDYTITSESNELEGYIDINVESDITVSFDNKQWTISGHDAVKVIDTDATSVTESELQDYLKNN